MTATWWFEDGRTVKESRDDVVAIAGGVTVERADGDVHIHTAGQHAAYSHDGSRYADFTFGHEYDVLASGALTVVYFRHWADKGGPRDEMQVSMTYGPGHWVSVTGHCRTEVTN